MRIVLYHWNIGSLHILLSKMARVVVYQYSWDQHWPHWQKQQQQQQKICNYLIELEFEIRDFAENVMFLENL